MRRIHLALAVLATLAALPPARAQPAPAAPPAPQAPAPAAPAPAPAAKPPGVTVDLSGWLIANAYWSDGGLNASDLPQWATTAHSTAGMTVRQSRVRAALGLPVDGLLGGAVLKGLVEADFMGTYVNSDASMPQVRLRHAYLTAACARGNLTLLVGQTWSLFGGPWFAASLGHVALPRFAGAGYLYRRAPQVRLTAEAGRGRDVGVTAAVAALASSGDKATSQNQLVGERAGVPDAEGRLALVLRRAGKAWLEVGASGRFGQQLWKLDGLSTPREERLTGWGVAADGRLEVPHLVVQGGTFMGEVLGGYGSVAPVVRPTKDATDATKLDAISPVRTGGFWAQAVVTPIPVLQLLGGYGIEEPRTSDLPAGAEATTIERNQQVSGGAILALTSRWKVSLEGTLYTTETLDGARRESTQVEVGSLYAF
ncbi:hypothetical protein [Anaeromyxobacter dehalogenans]|uniref:Porin n=1 Tax=Anaeromyxobacter dehalogenans (strain 2CP-C) TaxID=290397 RepID=Q2ILY4_ANADE|nr:hypothetical protein [Anaeromyxobacter dehalogenans]ABC79813.1 hypothetical protein Adeh_0035 [Anaeromyxobacter dehalogenans 2CP-C]